MQLHAVYRFKPARLTLGGGGREGRVGGLGKGEGRGGMGFPGCSFGSLWERKQSPFHEGLSVVMGGLGTRSADGYCSFFKDHLSNPQPSSQ